MSPNPISSQTASPNGIQSRQSSSQQAPSTSMNPGPSSKKATHGSTSSIHGQISPAAQHRNSNPGDNTPATSNDTRSSSWAIEMWLKQAPRDEPWNPLRR